MFRTVTPVEDRKRNFSAKTADSLVPEAAAVFGQFRIQPGIPWFSEFVPPLLAVCSLCSFRWIVAFASHAADESID